MWDYASPILKDKIEYSLPLFNVVALSFPARDLYLQDDIWKVPAVLSVPDKLLFARDVFVNV